MSLTHRRAAVIVAISGLLTLHAGTSLAQTTRPTLEAAQRDSRWLRPTDTTRPAAPEWGHADGLRVGLAPLPGPRGLLRIYAPYLGQAEPTMINFIAIEPTPLDADDRGLSELEWSDLDHARGKRFWSADSLGSDAPLEQDHPARGIIETAADGVEQLVVFVRIERYVNGAHVALRLRFRADRPHEVGIAVYAEPDSKPLRTCIATATMGNYARLRTLALADRAVSASSLWPGYRGDGFTPHVGFPLGEFTRTEQGDAIVSATPDETDPAGSNYEPGTPRGWHYTGVRATQLWRMHEPPPELRVQVNGRMMYWASHSLIPGGIAFENFELVAPFEQGQEFWFGVEPTSVPATTGATTRPTAQ